MIPRHQTVLFVILLVASTVMGVVLWQLRNRAHQRLLAGEHSTPTQAPPVAPTAPATLLVAQDADDTLLAQTESLPLPGDPGSSARLILGKLLDLYAAAGSPHPVPGGASAITQVFFLPVPAAAPVQPNPSTKTQERGSLVVVNLTSAFANSHPSGIEAESLTIESIVATLHANFPAVTEVRFLVDGQTRATLAGHADLTRTYLTADSVPTVQEAHP